MSIEEFPILKNGIYANHAALAPWPAATAKAVSDFADENSNAGPKEFRQWMDREQDLRQRYRELIGAKSPKDIALLSNTTGGISTVAYGLAWQSGDNIVLPAGEFPSNRLPWLAQEIHGVEIREVDIRTAHDAENALIGAMDERTRVLAVSSVQFGDGFRLNLERLGAACAGSPALFFVDAIQQLGALPVDVERCGIDFLAADGHKWMLAPEGVAVFYSRDSARAQLALRQQGWHMYDFPWNFAREDWSPSTTARRFEAGSPNSLGQVGMYASLGVLLNHGLDKISEQILANTDQLMRGLASLPGITITSDTRPERRSGIVSFVVENDRTREVYKRLSTRGVTAALREGNIRLSPHYYQDHSVMERLLEKVETAL